MIRIRDGALAVVVIAAGLLSFGASGALAGSGDFCQSCSMSSGQEVKGPERARFSEVETWNSNGKGQASCAGVGSIGNWQAFACSNESSEGYKEAYCISGCSGKTSMHALLEDASPFSSVFTGWESYSETASDVQSASAGVLVGSNIVAPPLSQPSGTASAADDVAAGLSAFARPRRTSDAIPASATIVFSQASGANQSLSRRVGEDGVESWLIPGAESLCLESRMAADGIGGATCASLNDVEAGELGLTASVAADPGVELVAGVMPSGVSSVKLTLAEDGSITVPVSEDVYQAIVEGPVIAATAVGQDSFTTLLAPASTAGIRVG
ncbi:MAG TPA: hypothetical protein VGF95_05075 [Solirubrobacteraceae bacterium]